MYSKSVYEKVITDKTISKVGEDVFFGFGASAFLTLIGLISVNNKFQQLLTIEKIIIMVSVCSIAAGLVVLFSKISAETIYWVRLGNTDQSGKSLKTKVSKDVYNSYHIGEKIPQELFNTVMDKQYE